MPWPAASFRAGAVPVLLVAALASTATGCSVKRFALTRVANSLAETGDAFEGDDDPDLVGAALPFSLKMMESLAEQVPGHQGVRLACARGFTSYAYAYVQQPAEMEGGDLARRDEAYLRARRLYARGLDTGSRRSTDRTPPSALGSATIRSPPRTPCGASTSRCSIGRRRRSVWRSRCRSRTPRCWGGCAKSTRCSMRALALDEAWGRGALHEFAITLEGARPPDGRRDPRAARAHYDRALALSGGRRASLFVDLRGGALPCATRTPWRSAPRSIGRSPSMLRAAREDRLTNLLAQRRARWLVAHQDDLILAGTSDRPPTHTRKRPAMTGRTRAAALAASIVLAGPAAGLAQAPIEIRLGTVAPQKSPWYSHARRHAAGVDARLGRPSRAPYPEPGRGRAEPGRQDARADAARGGGVGCRDASHRLRHLGAPYAAALPDLRRARLRPRPHHPAPRGRAVEEGRRRAELVRRGLGLLLHAPSRANPGRPARSPASSRLPATPRPRRSSRPPASRRRRSSRATCSRRCRPAWSTRSTCHRSSRSSISRSRWHRTWWTCGGRS